MKQLSTIILIIGGFAILYGIFSNLLNGRYEQLYESLKELGIFILLFIAFSIVMIIFAIIQEVFL